MRKVSILLLISLIISGCTIFESNFKREYLIKNIDLDKTNKTDVVKVTENKNSKETKTIVIGAIDYPPFEYVENGELKGPGIEIAKEAFDRMGYDYTLDLYPWSKLLNDTRNGNIDVMLDVYYNDDRAKHLIYSKKPYGIYPQIFIAKKNRNISYNTLDDLSNMTIGLERDYYYGDLFQEKLEEGILEVEYVGNIENNLKKLLNERIDLVAESYYSAKIYIEKNDLGNELEIIDNSFDQLISYVCFSKKNGLEDLKVEYDKTIAQMREDGRFEKILKKYDMEMLIERYQKSIEKNTKIDRKE